MKGETLFTYNNISEALCQPEVVVDSPESMAALRPGRRVDASVLFGEQPGELAKQRLAAVDYASILAAALPSSEELDGGDPWRTPAGKSIDAMQHCGKRRIAARVRSADAAAPQFAHISGRYCKGPVCPICAARRAHNSQAKYLAALSYIQGERLSAHQKPFQAVYMVLSFENQSPRAVPAARLVFTQALKYFCDVTQNKKYAVVVRDSIRTIESTLNTDVSPAGVLSPWFGTLNIHANILALVPESYFKKSYVKQADLANDWRDCIIRACRYYQKHGADFSGVWADLLFRHTPEYDKAPNGCFQPFDPARYLGPHGEAIVDIQRVRDKKNRKSMDITSGVVETVKYCLKSDDLEKLRSASAAAGLPDDLALQVLLGYCCLFYDLRRCTSRGLWRSALKALCLSSDSEDVGAEAIELDPHKAQVVGLFWASNTDAAGYILGGQYLGPDAVFVLSAYLTGDVLALLHGLNSPDDLLFRSAALNLPDLSDVDISVKDFRKGYARNHPNRTGRKAAQRVQLSKTRLGTAADPMQDAAELPASASDADIFPDGVQESLFDD